MQPVQLRPLVGEVGAEMAAAALLARERAPSDQRRQQVRRRREALVTPELRESLWEDAGLLRNADGLVRLTSSPHLLASLVARSALARAESRGGHFREDFPDETPGLDGLHTVVRPGREPELERWS